MQEPSGPSSDDVVAPSLDSSKPQLSPVSSRRLSSTSSPKLFIPKTSSHRQSQLLGKRTHNQQKKDQSVWLNSPRLVPKKQHNSEDNAIFDASHPIDGGDSLLDRILHKRQRVNSDAAFKKQEFSFLPTLAAPSVGGGAAASLKRSRDLKASEKSNGVGAALNNKIFSGNGNANVGGAPSHQNGSQKEQGPMPIEI